MLTVSRDPLEIQGWILGLLLVGLAVVWVIVAKLDRIEDEGTVAKARQDPKYKSMDLETAVLNKLEAISKKWHRRG